MKNLSLLCWFGLFLFSACSKKHELADVTSAPQLPEQTFIYNDFPGGIPLIDGGFSTTQSLSDLVDNEVATLGRVLFYDPKLSATNRVSCASCHLQEAAFSDVRRFSSGFTNELTHRNAMPICNTAFQNRGFFWDLRAESLEDLVSQPIENHIEMGMEDIDVLAQKLATVDYYPPLFEKAFGDNNINAERIADAVTQFMHAMISFDSKYDQGLNNNFANFTELENLGRKLFFEKANCESCHNAPTFSSTWGGGSANIGLDMEYEDPGIISSGIENSGHFKIPSLRNIQLTAPYMHDGRFNTLEEVVEHYNSGIKNHPYLDWRLKSFDEQNGVFTDEVRRLNLSSLEKQALVAFLKTLTDESFISDTKFSNPFAY